MTKLSKVEQTRMALKGVSTQQQRDELYKAINDELPTLEDKLNKWHPRSEKNKRLKGQLTNVLESLKITAPKAYNYTLDSAKFSFLKENLKK
ncbi:MAG: hypothetical protein VZR53_12090 [Prevotella sp.]|nr:hypothetical protein [Prevotella sp.]